MNSISEKDIDRLISVINEMDEDRSKIFCRSFDKEKVSYYSDSTKYFSDRIIEYDFNEIFHLRELLKKIWVKDDQKKLISTVLYLCEKMKDEDVQKYLDIDLVNYMM